MATGRGEGGGWANIPDRGPEGGMCLVGSRARRSLCWSGAGCVTAQGDAGRPLGLAVIKDVGLDPE